MPLVLFKTARAAVAAGLLFLYATLHAAPLSSDQYFGIEVVDEETGRGVPLVELQTVHNITYITDSAGRVAFYEPGLMDDEVHFSVRAHGYEFPADGFGIRGFVATTTPGKSIEIEVKRHNLAERLYRLTGGGIYRDSFLLGHPLPMDRPLINNRVLGQDSTMAVEYRDRVFWFWGDTNKPSYPLGNYDMTGATTASGAKLNPEESLDYAYFNDERGFTKKMAPMPGEGPTWLGGLTVLQENGEEMLVGGYAKIRDGLETYARGLVVYDDDREVFKQAQELAMESPLYPIGHSLHVDEEDESFVHFMNPLPLVRVRAELESYMDPSGYEAFTPLVPGSGRGAQQVERDEEGNVVYDWKMNTAEAGPAEQRELVETGLLQPQERLFALRDWRTGKAVTLHAGSVSWNRHRGRWILIASEIFGDSALGEVWFAEADSPLGPWIYAQKIVSHNDYTFYNPRHHPFLDRDDGRLIYFEGTYTQLFSGAPEKTPRYDYNQILYRLDLADPELKLPVAVYRDNEHDNGCVVSARRVSNNETGRPEFWAFEEPTEGSVPVRCRITEAGECEFMAADSGSDESSPGQVLFYGLAAEETDLPADAIPLYKRGAEGEEIVCYVWKNPLPKAPALPIRLEP